jgi:type IV pilus assembly protein PilV
MKLHHRQPTAARRQRGFSMMEVLVTLLVTAFGLLGLAGFVTRSTAVAVDADQRARAVSLLADMGSRLQNNKTNAAAYVSDATYGGEVQTCPTAMGAQRDLCEWNNLLAGANDTTGGAQALSYRGCITQPTPGAPLYVVTVAWGSALPGVPPADLCAKDVFGDDSLRRVIRTQVRVTNLSA